MSCPKTNPISFLQELCHKDSKRLPVYSEGKPTGQDHCPRFSCSCAFEGYESVGSGSDKKSAKKNAAENMIVLLQNNGFLSKVADEYLNKGSKKIGKTAALKDPISALMEFCAKEKMDPPKYSETEAPLGSTRSFFFECRIKEKVTYGEGDNKKSAKKNCSAKMCELINIPFQIEEGAKNGHDTPILQLALDTNEISNPRSVTAFSESENDADYLLMEYNDEDTKVENNFSSFVLPVFQNLHLNDSDEEVEPTSTQKEYLKCIFVE